MKYIIVTLMFSLAATSYVVAGYDLSIFAQPGIVVDENLLLEVPYETPVSINNVGDIAYLGRFDFGEGLVAQEDVHIRQGASFSGWVFPNIKEEDDYHLVLDDEGSVYFGYTRNNQEFGEPQSNGLIIRDDAVVVANAGEVDGIAFHRPSPRFALLGREPVYHVYQLHETAERLVGLISSDRALVGLGDSISDEIVSSFQVVAPAANEKGDVAYVANSHLVLNNEVAVRLGSEFDGHLIGSIPTPLAIDSLGDVVFEASGSIFSLNNGHIIGRGDSIDGIIVDEIEQVVATDATNVAFIGRYGNQQLGVFSLDELVIELGTTVDQTRLLGLNGGLSINDHGSIAVSAELANGEGAVIKASYFLPGDTDGDHMVDVNDLNTLALNWQMPGDRSQGDFNNDGVVDSEDLNILGLQWQAGVTNHQIVTPVPEYVGVPSLLAWLALVTWRRRCND